MFIWDKPGRPALTRDDRTMAKPLAQVSREQERPPGGTARYLWTREGHIPVSCELLNFPQCLTTSTINPKLRIIPHRLAERCHMRRL